MSKYTFEQAVEQYMERLPWGLKALYEKDKFRNPHPFYCPHCGWYYPHDNWEKKECPVCKSLDIIQTDNSMPTYGLFSML